MNIGFFLGPAGSGKSQMTMALNTWMRSVGLNVETLNLDPAVIRLPYGPSVDVREIISYDDIVDEYELGPNGAMVASVDQIALQMDEIIERVEEINPDYLLVDLPGQMEVFAYRSSGLLILNQLSKSNTIGGLFLIDPILCATATSFVSILLLGASINYRLNTPLKFAISKGDLIPDSVLEKLDEWSEYPDLLLDAIRNDKMVLSADLSLRFAEVMAEYEVYANFPVISSQTNQNIDLAYGEFQRIWNSEDLFT